MASADSVALAQLFVNLVDAISADYAYATIHLDGEDSDHVEAEFLRRRKNEPIDFLNDSRFTWDCDRRIRDVAWLNYLGTSHLEQLRSGFRQDLEDLVLPGLRQDGVAFRLGDNPWSVGVEVLAYMRHALSILISPSHFEAG